MDTSDALSALHPQGEPQKSLSDTETGGPLAPLTEQFYVETFGGRMHIEWDADAPFTAMGQLSFFIEFLHTANLFNPWVEECPLAFTSPNAPKVRDVLGTMMLSVLAGHWRYAHATALRGDTVNPPQLGMTKVVSEDSMRRFFKDGDEEACVAWMRRHLLASVRPLLTVPWILDVDTTVKPLYGHQQGAVLGYNPQKPGRPSHAIHSYIMANTRLILEAEVESGNHTHSTYGMVGLWRLIDGLDPRERPALVRGDCGYGNENLMVGAEERGLKYLFKLRMSANVKKFVERKWASPEWSDAGQGWEFVEDKLRLTGWKRDRRVIVLRRLVGREVVRYAPGDDGQMKIEFGERVAPGEVYEYAVLVTNLEESGLSVAQLYRDRADAENVFDELKNQWGWGGFSTRDMKRSQIMTRAVALFYNWWSLFARLAMPEKHAEAITSRPMLLGGVARQTESARQRRLTITTPHAKSGKIITMLSMGSRFLRAIRDAAEQLTPVERWRRILEEIFKVMLHGRPIPPLRRALAPG